MKIGNPIHANIDTIQYTAIRHTLGHKKDYRHLDSKLRWAIQATQQS